MPSSKTSRWTLAALTENSLVTSPPSGAAGPTVYVTIIVAMKPAAKSPTSQRPPTKLGLCETTVTSAGKVKTVTLEFGDAHETLDVAAILVGAGRIPNTENIGLEVAGVLVVEEIAAAHIPTLANSPLRQGYAKCLLHSWLMKYSCLVKGK